MPNHLLLKKLWKLLTREGEKETELVEEKSPSRLSGDLSDLCENSVRVSMRPYGGACQRRLAPSLGPSRLKQRRSIFRWGLTPFQPNPVHPSQPAASVCNPSTQTAPIMLRKRKSDLELSRFIAG
jgi:hypothetical protein